MPKYETHAQVRKIADEENVPEINNNYENMIPNVNANTDINTNMTEGINA